MFKNQLSAFTIAAVLTSFTALARRKSVNSHKVMEVLRNARNSFRPLR